MTQYLSFWLILFAKGFARKLAAKILRVLTRISVVLLGLQAEGNIGVAATQAQETLKNEMQAKLEAERKEATKRDDMIAIELNELRDEIDRLTKHHSREVRALHAIL